MKFGFDKYVQIEGSISNFPLPNALVAANEIPRSYGELRKYNVYDSLFKQGLNYKGFNYGHDTIDNLLKEDEFFVYPILITHTKQFHDISNEVIYRFSDKLLRGVKRGKAKILLSYIFEGDFYRNSDIEAINNFSKKYDLGKNDVIVLTNNLKYKYEPPPGSNFVTIPFNYFLVNPWFTKQDFLEDKINTQSGAVLVDKLSYLRTFIKPKKFLSLNRRPRLHRILLFTEIMKDSTLRENSIISMGNTNLESLTKNDKTSWSELYNNHILESYSHNKQSGIDFLNEYDSTKDFFVDSNLEYNLAYNFNETLHLNTFVNILTETLFENSTVFLSEKIFKPILGCQPFIVFGNPGIIQELNNIGFKTFNYFWDESYDYELNLSKRLEKIITILKNLAEKSDQELLEITKQMLPILEHNYQYMRIAARDEVYKLKTTLDGQFIS